MFKSDKVKSSGTVKCTTTSWSD